MGKNQQNMMEGLLGKFNLVFKYIKYLFTAMNGKGHGIHSPFVFDFVINVLDTNKYKDQEFKKIETIRKELCSSDEELVIQDLGAGSKFSKTQLRTIGSITRSAAKPQKYAQLLYRMVKHYQIDHVLEMGTSLGLTTRYLALAKPKHGIITIEGAPSIASFTKSMFLSENIQQVEILEGDFKIHLQPALDKMQGRKLIFVDGNHDRDATVEYFKKILNYCSTEDVIVFDDIRWSKGMEEAWQEIQKSEKVTCTIDLFFVGIVIFRKEFKEKLDFTIRF